MISYDDYLVHVYIHATPEQGCRWCYPAEQTEPPWELLRETELIDYRKRGRLTEKRAVAVRA